MPARCSLLTALLLLGLATAGPAEAGLLELQGSIQDASTEAAYEVWLTSSPDLAAADSVLARAQPEPSGRFELRANLPEPQPPLWLFLRQELGQGSDQPMVFFVPWDLLPVPPAALQEELRFRSLPVDLALLQLGGEQPKGWWHTPAVLTGLLLIGVPLLGLFVRRRLRQLESPEGRPAAPRSPPEIPEVRWERPAVGGLLLLAAGLRIPRMGESLELLEHTYGPGLPGVRESAGPPIWELLGSSGSPGLGELLPALLEPPSLIVTHPPLYHWLTAGLAELQAGDWLLRVPALLASLATVLLAWRLMRRVAPAAGVAAAGACSVAAPGIFYGGDASPYALVGAACIGSLLLLLRALEDGRRRAWAAWLGLLAVGFLCHYTVAIFGLLQGAVLGALLLRHRADARWLGSAGNLLAVLPWVGLAPVLWTWPHFATFEIVGLDTRLMAEAFPRSPGLLSWATDVLAVLCSVSPRYPLAALPLLLLAGRGLQVSARRDPILATLCGVSLLAGFVGVLFFYFNLTEILHGRVFWGFRWISWLTPVALALGAAGLVGSEGRSRAFFALLGAAWLVAALSFSFAEADRSTRPDYRGAARQIAAEAQDHDGVAALPLWGQRGPLLWYVSQELDFDLRTPASSWPVALLANPTHEQLPFETSANNGHVDRLWLAIVDERMFGRPKFVEEQAQQALDWARTHMEPDGTWSFDHLELHRFRRGKELSWDGSQPLEITHPKADLASLRWQEPNQWNCGQVSDFDTSGPDPASPAASGWRLHLRVPLAAGLSRPKASVAEGATITHDEPGFWSATVLGGRCEDAPPTVRLERAD